MGLVLFGVGVDWFHLYAERPADSPCQGPEQETDVDNAIDLVRLNQPEPEQNRHKDSDHNPDCQGDEDPRGSFDAELRLHPLPPLMVIFRKLGGLRIRKSLAESRAIGQDKQG